MIIKLFREQLTNLISKLLRMAASSIHHDVRAKPSPQWMCLPPSRLECQLLSLKTITCMVTHQEKKISRTSFPWKRQWFQSSNLCSRTELTQAQRSGINKRERSDKWNTWDKSWQRTWRLNTRRTEMPLTAIIWFSKSITTQGLASNLILQLELMSTTCNPSQLIALKQLFKMKLLIRTGTWTKRSRTWWNKWRTTGGIRR